MTLEQIEEIANEKGLRGKDHQEYEHLLDLVIEREGSFKLWNRLYMVSIALFLWAVMFAAILYLLSFDYEFDLPPGIGMFFTIVLAFSFVLTMVTMFLSAKRARQLATDEARILAFLENR